MTTLTEKYRPKSLSEIISQDSAILKLKEFIAGFSANNGKQKKAALLHGPAGTGKTTLAHAIANDIKAEKIEVNASDFRNKEQLELKIKPATEQHSLFNPSRIIIMDEIDGLSSREDRGGIATLLSLIEKTNFPIIMTANNIWDSNFSKIRSASSLIEFKEISYLAIAELLKRITEKENIEIEANILKQIAIQSKGDIRAALNDLESLKHLSAEGNERDKEISIFNAMQSIFKNKVTEQTLSLYDSVNMPLEDISLWLEENIPSEYKGKELARAISWLSKADVFKGRIYRQQHWRFLVYQNIFLSAGIASAKKKPKLGFTAYKKPSRILSIWMSNQRKKEIKSITEKFAGLAHIGKKRAMRDFHTLKYILRNKPVQEELKLTEEEIAFIQNN